MQFSVVGNGKPQPTQATQGRRCLDIIEGRTMPDLNGRADWSAASTALLAGCARLRRARQPFQFLSVIRSRLGQTGEDAAP